MSAMNVLIQSNAVHLLTDASVFHPDGELLMIGPKAVPMPHLNCALAVRGPAGAKMVFAEAIAYGAATFDGLRQSIVEILKEQATNLAGMLDLCKTGREFEVVVAGISESVGPTAFIVSSHGLYGQSWAPIDLAGFVALPCDEIILAKVQAILPQSGSADDFDPERDGLAALEIQRARPQLSNGDFCPIGGFAQLTTVTTESVTSRIIHRWPDKIGQKLGNAA